MSDGWADQPREVVDLPVVCKFYASPRLIEVRKGAQGWYYVTIGNLFGSETIECASTDVAWEVVDLATSVDEDGPKAKLPLGAEIMK